MGTTKEEVKKKTLEILRSHESALLGSLDLLLSYGNINFAEENIEELPYLIAEAIAENLQYRCNYSTTKKEKARVRVLRSCI